MNHVFLLLISVLGGTTADADHRCGAIVNASEDKWEKQRSFRFPPIALAVESVQTASTDSSSMESSRQSLVATTGEHGIAAVLTPDSDDRPGVLLVNMMNEKYYATVSRILSPDIRLVSRLDQFTDGYRNAGFSGLSGSEIWIDRVIRAETSGGYLASSIFDFSQYAQAWRSSKASLDCSLSDGSRGHHQLNFFDLKSKEFADVERCEFSVEAETLLVVSIRCITSKAIYKYSVKSFTEIGGVNFPSELRYSVGSDAVQESYNTIARFQPLDSVGFKKEQLYLSYYGLAEPNAEAIAKPKRYTGFVYLAIGVSLGLVCAFLYWRKTR